MKTTTRMERINTLTAELRDLCGDDQETQQQIDIRMAAHFGIPVEDLDEYDSRIGRSMRELADELMAKWGTW